MFISHETKCVNMDNIDTMEVAHRDLYNDYIIEIRKNNTIVLCIYSSGHMTFEEAKFVYENILACLNGVYYDTRKKRYVEREESTRGRAILVDESTVDDVIKVYHDQIEKKEA